LLNEVANMLLEVRGHITIFNAARLELALRQCVRHLSLALEVNFCKEKNK
jgi:hypothetical protein